MPDRGVDNWQPLRSELAAEVGRVADRLRSMSQARLAGKPAPSEGAFPPYGTRAQAARAVATDLAHTARCLEQAVAGAGAVDWWQVPQLSDFAAGDQVAVAGHDLLMALELVQPTDEVWFGQPDRSPARDGVSTVLRLLTDLRRRL